jgi:hypothetical protein
MTENDGQQIETEAKAVEGGMTPVDVWLKHIEKAKEDEKDWRDSAERAICIYEAGEPTGMGKNATTSKSAFNIYHSNIETMVPAAYNSTPIPDIRRRYDDPDPTSKAGVDIIERAISYSVDQYEFDTTMRDVVRTSLTAGRGVPRVRYKPKMKQAVDPMTGQPVEVLGYQEVTCEVVPWDRFIRGPGRTWDEVKWIAFEHDLTRDEIDKLAERDTSQDISINDQDKNGDRKGKAKPDAGIYKTTKVYEIWDKGRSMVLFIRDERLTEPLRVEQDPLGLPEFFCVPRPLQPIWRLSSLTPVCPYDVYEALIEELDTVTKRITKLARQLRVKGLYNSEMKADFGKLQSADDGIYEPVDDATKFAAGAGGLDKQVWNWPIETIAGVIERLKDHRDSIVQTIYEVTGLSDIVRGSTAASETATAQQIKAQYAGLRIQHFQKEVQRVARDLFRMKAAIICKHFSTENLQIMTGLQVTPQIEQLIRSDALRAYRIDIETDSTIRGDVGRKLEQMSQFIQGTAQFAQAIGGVIQTAPPLLPMFTEIYASFARQFDLGKQAEDALDGMTEQVKQFMQQQQSQPNPEAEKAKIEGELRQQEMGMKREMAQEELGFKREAHQMDMQMKTFDLQVKQQSAQIDMEAKQRGAEIDAQKAVLGAQVAQQKAAMQPNGAARQ